jgi:predicted  nucleic acid-binding Zn-ribbon protein
MSRYSQCSNCGNTFAVWSDEVLYCSARCRNEHDLFVHKERSQASEVIVSFLSEAELEKYRNRKKPYASKKIKHVADWRWPRNRRKNEGSVGMATKGHS